MLGEDCDIDSRMVALLLRIMPDILIGYELFFGKGYSTYLAILH